MPLVLQLVILLVVGVIMLTGLMWWALLALRLVVASLRWLVAGLRGKPDRHGSDPRAATAPAARIAHP